MTDLAEESPISETPAEAEVHVATVDATTDAVAAESSTALDAKEVPALSLLDVVKAVVEPKAAEPEASSAASEKKTDGSEATAPQELTAEEIAALPFHNHPRFKEVLEQKNAFKAEAAEAQARIKEYEAPAEQWGHVQNFMTQNNLSDEDMLDGFRMMAMVRMDPIKGRQAIADYLGDLDKSLGLVLPEDLRDDVDNGLMSEERAYELSQARVVSSNATERARQEVQERQQAQERQQQTDTATALTTAATAWEARVRARDPDFERKEGLIADRMRAIAMAERLTPRTGPEIDALLDRAHADVTAQVRRFNPAPRQVNRPTSASSATVAAPAPKSMREAIALAARG